MKQIISMFLLLLFLTGCHLTPKPHNNKTTLDNLQSASYDMDKNGNIKLKKVYSYKDKKDKKIKHKVTTTDILSSEKSYERVPLFDRGYKRHLILKGEKRKTFSVKGGKVKVSVEAIPANEFIDLVFGSVLKVNYTVNENVKKIKAPITLNMTEPQKASKFFEVVKKILLINGIGVKNDNNMFFIYKTGAKLSKIPMSDIYIGYGRYLPNYIDDDREVMLFVPYNYINPNNVVNVLRQIGIDKVKFYYFINGIQTMRGKAGNIRKALKFIDLLDRPYLEGKLPYLINLQNIEVDKFLSQMKQIFTINGINVVNSPSKGGIVMIPIKSLNSLYIITPKKEWLNMILYWKNKLDILKEVSSKPRLYIYHVKNRKADDLAKAVSDVLGLSQEKRIKNKISISVNKKTKIKKTNNIASGGFLLSGEDYTPTVKADLNTNILMLKLSPQDYKIILPFIKQLDRLPLQTLVEVTVAEIDMTDNFSLGFEYTLRSKGLGVSDILTVTGSGSGLGVVFSGDKIDAVVNAFAEKKLLDILSRPKLLILNNTTGSINVGDQVPVVTSETSAADVNSGDKSPTIVRNIKYRTTGINLSLTPTINSNGVLTMKISISLSQAQLNDTSGIDSPLIVNRQLNTEAVINSGDTILIGGLISHNKSKSKGGIPYLKDIPLIGGMFATQSHKITKTELIMLIRPVIIKNVQKIKNETDRFKTLLKYINIDDL